MRRLLVGVGAIWIGATCGCSGDEPAPGSTIGQSANDGGKAGFADSISLGDDGGSAGTGGGGSGGSGGLTTGGTGAMPQAGLSTGAAASGGTPSQAGAGSGGSKPAGTCKRQPASDADCADFYEDKPQAYACDDISAASTLNQSHAAQCGSVTFVSGAKYGECCPP
jgi:hypothetical protein